MVTRGFSLIALTNRILSNDDRCPLREASHPAPSNKEPDTERAQLFRGHKFSRGIEARRQYSQVGSSPVEAEFFRNVLFTVMLIQAWPNPQAGHYWT